MKSNTIAANDGLFKSHQSYSPQEILSSGGTTAFGIKSGKNNQTLIKKLKSLPPIDDFSDDEWDKLQAQLNAGKE